MDRNLTIMAANVRAIIEGQNESSEMRNAIDELLSAYKDPERCDDVFTYLAQKAEGKKCPRDVAIIQPANIYEELAMTYDDYVAYLRDKHGPSKHDAYVGGQCVSLNNNIHRKNEGLFLHHIAEQCHVRLDSFMDVGFARERPFELQRADNFIYCNYLEHLMLHIKIAMDDICVADKKVPIIDFGGAEKIWKDLNQYYAVGRIGLSKKAAISLVENDYDKYITIMTFLLKLVFNSGLKRSCPLEEFAEEINGAVLDKIYNDLHLDDYRKPDMWGDLIL